MTPTRADNAATRFLNRSFGIEPQELFAVAWSFVYFFCILSAYYMLRSVREAMAIVGGVENIPWLFTGTFAATLVVAPVFGWIASRYRRRTFLPWVYYFFIANILLFFAAFTWFMENERDVVWVSRSFFVWLSVFNLFIVSVFWSFMADIYTKEQSRRLFGIISAGGSTGAILGPAVTSVLVIPLGFENLLPLSAALLAFAVYCVHRLRGWSMQKSPNEPRKTDESPGPLGGTALAGIKLVFTTPYLAAIAISLVLANFLGGAIYMYMAELVRDAFAETDRQTQVFAIIDALTNVLSFIGQLFIVKMAVQRLGIGMTLAILPLVSIVGFALLALNPVFTVIAVFQVLRRSVTFGLTKPTSDMLYSVVSREAKYKAKNFVETAIYRGGDLVSTWIIRSLSGIGLTGVSLVCLPLAVIWSGLSFWIGRDYRRRDQTHMEGTAHETG
ncbi:MAG: MFS transporter [Woeseia sp.]